MTTITPKACPFCDSDTAAVKLIEIDLVHDDPEKGFPICVSCNNCGAKGPIIYTTDMDTDEPLEKWNDRPVEDRLSKMVLDTEKRFRR